MERTENDDDLLLLSETSELVRLPVATLRWLRHCGTGPPSFKVGRHVMYQRGEVKRWIREQERMSAR